MYPGAVDPEVISGSAVVGTNTTADNSLTLGENQIAEHGSHVRRSILTFTGTTVTLANYTRLTVKCKGQLRMDGPLTHWRALLGYFMKKAAWTSTDNRLVIPHDMFVGLGCDPSGDMRIEVTKNATPTGSPTMRLHQVIDRGAQAPGYAMFICQSQSLIVANCTTQPVTLAGEGALHGIVVPDAANITLLRIKAAGRVVQEYVSGDAILAAGDLERGTTVTTEVFVPVDGIPMIPGQVEIVVSAGAGFTAGEWGLFTLAQTK